MSKKRAKSGAGLGSAGPPKWDQAIVSTPFYEEGLWNAALVWVVGQQAEDYSHIDTLASAVNSGARKLFSHVTKEDLYEMVNDLGNPKSKKAKEIPANYEVCEPCKNYLDSNEDIPLPLLAKLVKFRLLDVKQKDVQRRETEKKVPAAAGGADKGGKGAKGGKADKERAKSAGKGNKGGKKTPEPPSPKGETKLRRRGEEDTDSKYIDDEPDDGPEHYIFVSGFHQPQLLLLLADLGVNADAIIKIESNNYATLQLPQLPDGAEPPSEENLQADEEAKAKIGALRKELKAFWRDTIAILQKAPEGSKLHDLARLEYVVKTERMPENMEDAEKKTEFGLALFEDTACLVYDLLDARRQWQNFLSKLHLIHVPLIGGSDPASQAFTDSQSQHSATPALTGGAGSLLAPPGAGAEIDGPASKVDVDMRYYKELMDTVPQESSSVPLIMHCMLEQVCAWDEDREPPSEVVPAARSDGLEDGVASHITNIAFKLALSPEEQQMLATELKAPNVPSGKSKTPLLIDHSDQLTSRLHRLQPINGFDPAQTELDMLGRMPFLDRLRVPRPSAKTGQARAARLQELLHYCANSTLTQAEIDRAFRQFTLECLTLTSIDEDGSVVENCSPSLCPWDDPYPVFSGVPLPEEKEEQEVDEAENAAKTAASTDDRAVAMVEATKLQSKLEGLQKQISPSPPPRPESAGSGRSSRSRARNKKLKGGKSPPPPRVTTPPAPPVEQSRPSSGGILKSPSRNGSLHSRRSSVTDQLSDGDPVHFETDVNGQPMSEPGDTTEAAVVPVARVSSVEEVVNSIVNSQRRILDQWCFTEKFESKVLRQVLCEASQSLPVMDTYYQRRENALLLVLHNPYNSALHSSASWQTKLHSNVGFRNYLEHIAGSIEEWTRDEEAKYQAESLAKEVDRIQKEADAGSRPASGAGKKGRDRSKSPKKAGSRTGRSSSRGSSAERPSSTNMFIREGSLKAQKMELDAVKAEQEEQERQKGEKRARSAAKKEKEEEKDRKKAGSRSSSKSRMSKDAVETEAAAAADSEQKKEEPSWPFAGYDVGNKMAHVGGTVTTMFPADGGQIKVEKTEFVHGTVSVSTVVHKDGHQFMVHVLDPKVKDEDEDKEEPEKQEEEGQDGEDLKEAREEKPTIGRFGSLSACFNDGMCLALSTYGSTGAGDNGREKDEVDLFEIVLTLDVGNALATQTPRSPSPSAKADSPTKSRKDKGKTSTPEPVLATEEEGVTVEQEKEVPAAVEQQFQQVYITCPDGLCVTYMLESALGIQPADESQRHLVVRQSYPFKTGGYQECEAARRTAMAEISRVITSQGIVLRFMADGSTVVLYPDGQVSHLDGLPTVEPHSRTSSPQRVGSAKSNAGGGETPTRKETSDRKDVPLQAEKVVEKLDQMEKSLRNRKGIVKTLEKSVDRTLGDTSEQEEDGGRGKKSAQNKESVQEEDPSKKGQWMTILPSGGRIAHHLDGTKIDVKDVKLCVASDPQTKQILYTREDNVVTVTHPDGSTVVEHSDGTRITSYTKDVEMARCDESSQETGEPGPSEMQQVKIVHVECPGYASVKFDALTTECSTEFGSGSVVHTYPSGSYDIYHQAGGYLQVETDGTAVYNPRANNDLELHHPDLDMRYLMRHFAETLVEVTDNEGNQFSVKSSGDTSVNLSGVSEAVTDADDEASKGRQVVNYKQHAPRFFVVHGDGSGAELLRYQDVAEYIATAEDDPSSAILMDPVQDHPGVMGITIMRPYLQGLSERWLCNYSRQNIMPPGLTSRDLKTLPPLEYKKDGPRFGTNVGQGLVVGGLAHSDPRPPVLKCPNVLEVRQLLQSKPVSQELRDSLQKGLAEYGKFVRTRQDESEALLVEDPRSEQEKMAAASMAAAAATLHIDCENVRTMYEKATTVPPPEPCPTPEPKRSRSALERDVRELEEEKHNRDALHHHAVPSYFDSELGKAFLIMQAPDLDKLTQDLAVGTLRGSPQRSGEDNSPDIAQTQDTSAHQSRQSRDVSERSISNSPPEGSTAVPNTDSPNIRDLDSTPSAVRPGNPTPAHATGQGSPAPLRPKNPTPIHANKTVVVDRPGAPTPKEGMASETPSSHVYPCIPEQPQEETTAFQPGEAAESSVSEPMMNRSLFVDVIGQPRVQPVAVPAYINKNGRPNAVSNQNFGQVEDPVRRHIFTSSVAGASSRGAHTLARMRGFELLPNFVNFGVLKEGNTYAFPVHLKNTGIDACRFRVKQPPPSTGLRVLFRPGPVAAGMKAELTLELYAIAVGVTGDSGVGNVIHNLEITTETDHLYLPVNATVLTAHEHDRRGPRAPTGGKAPGVKWISNRPPAGQGIIRPRRLHQGTEMLMS